MGDKGVFFLFFKGEKRCEARKQQGPRTFVGVATPLLCCSSLRCAARRDRGGSPQCISLGKGETLGGKEQGGYRRSLPLMQL